MLPSLHKKLPYDPIRDFAPVTRTVIFPNVLVVNNAVQARSVRELIALAKAQPGKLNFASSGIGSSNQMAGELLKVMAHRRAGTSFCSGTGARSRRLPKLPGAEASRLK